MNKRTKTTLRFILGGFLMATFAVTGCNNTDTEKVTTKDSVTTEVKTEMPAPAMKDSVKDTMLPTPGNVSPTPGGG